LILLFRSVTCCQVFEIVMYTFALCYFPASDVVSSISIRARCITLYDKVCQWLATGRWFSPGPPVSSTNKTDRHDITEILFKVVLNTIKQTNKTSQLIYFHLRHIIYRNLSNILPWMYFRYTVWSMYPSVINKCFTSCSILTYRKLICSLRRNLHSRSPIFSCSPNLSVILSVWRSKSCTQRSGRWLRLIVYFYDS
jgi:hypothetical protein